MNLRSSLLLIGVAALSALAGAQKKPLDHSVYDSWKSVQQKVTSNDGKWVAYLVSPQEGENRVEIKSTDGKTSHTFPVASNLHFMDDSRYFVCRLAPTKAEQDKAKEEKKEAPKAKLLILDLQNGQPKFIDAVMLFSANEVDNGWILYRAEAKPPTPPKKEDEKPAEKGKQEEKPKKKSSHRAGDTQTLLQVATGKEIQVDDVASTQFTKNGDAMVYVASTKDGSGDGIYWLDLASGAKTTIVNQLGQYPRILLQEDKPELAFFTDKDDYAAEKPLISAYIWRKGDASARKILDSKTPGVPENMLISSGGVNRLSKSGGHLVFSLQPKPQPEPPAIPAEQKVDVDIWHWKDPVLQPQQLLQANSVRNRTFEAILHISVGSVVVLEDDDVPSVTFDRNLESKYALATTSRPYQIEASWDTGYIDAYLVELETGKRTHIITKMDGQLGLSPTGKWVFGSDDQKGEIFLIEVPSGRKVVLNEKLPVSLYNEIHDVPAPASPYGVAGWGEGDDTLYMYDRFDVWGFDLKNGGKAWNATGGSGRIRETRFRILNLDPDREFLDPNQVQLFSAFDERFKDSGWFRGTLTGKGPDKVLMAPHRFGQFQKAKNSDVVTLTRESFEVFGDIHATTLDFREFTKLSDANPQQKDYNWATSELVSWISNDGDPLQGIIVKPEDFDPAKKYPMVVYFYERESDNLRGHRVPAPSASTINPTYFASNGYIVFMPDIPYKTGYPGESAVSAIMPGVSKVLEMGYVDQKRMGIQGQSWGGYQVAYLVTETNMFAAAGAGAPVSNMFSAYGGIRWGSGLVRQFQYEMGQSRIDGNMWDKPLRYLENSPIFFVDKVKTPLLIMSNDKDGAVPWYQGIEMFTAMRRLQKPCWLLVYNNEDHNLIQRKNRKDLSIRLSQFFDHYLKGAPMPVWMDTGVPATQKGKTMGYELKGEKKGD